jgi:hypothetical protein
LPQAWRVPSKIMAVRNFTLAARNDSDLVPKLPKMQQNSKSMVACRQ